MKNAGGTIVIGLGNPYRGDDGVGPAVARLVHARLADPEVELREAAVGGIELVEMLAGHARAVIIDAIKTEGGRVGDLYRVELAGSLSTQRLGMTHALGLLEGLALGRMLDLEVPDAVEVYAVEVADPYTFGDRMSEALEAALPAVARRILAEAFGKTGP